MSVELAEAVPMITGYDSFTRAAELQQRDGVLPQLDAMASADDKLAAGPAPRRVGHPHPARESEPSWAAGSTGAHALVAGRSRRGRFGRGLGVFAIFAIVGVVAWQAYALDHIGTRLVSVDRQLDDALAAQRSAAAAAEARTADLEQQAIRAFNPEAISAAVLPSVFRVRAGDFTGTAFAVGDKAAAGEANLLTNYHVVAAVWEAGDRTVQLERDGVEVSATIVKVDGDEDLAQLRMKREVAGLATTDLTVKTGQQIVVVGAPLGLEDSVTSGVVSAFRQDQEQGGPVIQFDAPINPGNSGGPVINSAEQVVGMATAKARDAEGIGLAIPITTACETFDIC